ncbi:hypothetical protein BDV09DRAFT_191827 [Aspergillus tetrazonus]
MVAVQDRLTRVIASTIFTRDKDPYSVPIASIHGSFIRGEASPEFQAWALPVTHQEFASSSSLSMGEPPGPPLQCHEAVTELNPEYYHVAHSRPESPLAAAKPWDSIPLALNTLVWTVDTRVMLGLSRTASQWLD